MHNMTTHYSAYLAFGLFVLAIIAFSWVLFTLFYRQKISRQVIQLLKGEQIEAHNTSQAIAKQMQQVLQERDLMLSALAHDIKTPLTEARLRLELMEDQTVAEQVKDKLDHIHQIIRSSLEFAREPAHVKKSTVDIVSLTETIVDSYDDGLFDISFHSDTPYCEYPLEKSLYKRLLGNLIDNAKKYANNARIIISQPDPNTLDVTCEDDGPGVPNQFLPLLTMPYYRVDQSRSRETGGVGLGLAIVKKIAELHQGKVIIRPHQAGQGFSVTIRFHIAPAKT